MGASPPAHPTRADERLPPDELFVLGVWATRAVAAGLGIDRDDAHDLLGVADAQGRIHILGTSMFAGVACDGEWLVAVDRDTLTRATHEWQTLRHMQRQFE